MKLDRNDRGGNKYAVVQMRKVRELKGSAWAKAVEALDALANLGVLVKGEAHTQDEFFVIMLRDRYAAAGLLAYALAAANFDDREYAAEVQELGRRAGPASPWCKTPD